MLKFILIITLILIYVINVTFYCVQMRDDKNFWKDISKAELRYKNGAILFASLFAPVLFAIDVIKFLKNLWKRL